VLRHPGLQLLQAPTETPSPRLRDCAESLGGLNSYAALLEIFAVPGILGQRDSFDRVREGLIEGLEALSQGILGSRKAGLALGLSGEELFPPTFKTRLSLAALAPGGPSLRTLQGWTFPLKRSLNGDPRPTFKIATLALLFPGNILIGDVGQRPAVCRFRQRTLRNNVTTPSASSHGKRPRNALGI
jgi:hypothetical protein